MAIPRDLTNVSTDNLLTSRKRLEELVEKAAELNGSRVGTMIEEQLKRSLQAIDAELCRRESAPRRED